MFIFFLEVLEISYLNNVCIYLKSVPWSSECVAKLRCNICGVTLEYIQKSFILKTRGIPESKFTISGTFFANKGAFSTSLLFTFF